MKSKLNLLIRKNQQRLKIPLIKKGIQSALNLTLSDKDFVDIEATDLIVDRFSQSFQDNGRFNSILFSENDARELDNIMNKIVKKYKNQIGYLLLSNARECGAIKMDFESPIRLWQELIRFDGDSFSLLSLDMKDAIHLDYFEGYVIDANEFFYELTEWKVL